MISARPTVIRLLTRPLAPLPVLLFGALALAGCASSYGAPINGERALSPEEQRLQAVETKLADLTRRFSSTEANRGQQMEQELGALRGSVEQLRHDFEVSQRKSQDQYAELDGRMKQIESLAAQAVAAGMAPPSAGIPGTTETPDGPASVPASSAADEEAAYLKSFDLLKAGKYDDAARGFRGVIDKYPQGNYTDNAWYWMGEAHNIRKDYPNALFSYRSLLEKFPASPKVPDALLKTGQILQEQKKIDQARTAYQRVIKEFPNSSAATQARSRLAQLR